MTNKEILLLILGMTLVTYIPRALPAVLADKMHFGEKTERFLQLIPYTAMASLIFPAILEEGILAGIAGGLAAAILAWKKCPVMACVLAAIAVELLFHL